MIRRAVLDASAALEVVLLGSRAREILDVLEGCPMVLAPSLFHAEVANALWKYVRAGKVLAEEASALLTTAIGLLDRAIPDAELVEEALLEATATAYPVYDLLYATAARRFGCTVVTLDRRLRDLLEKKGIPSWGKVP